MAQEKSSNMIVGLDIGTSKIVAIVGEITPEGNLEIVSDESFKSVFFSSLSVEIEIPFTSVEVQKFQL